MLKLESRQNIDRILTPVTVMNFRISFFMLRKVSSQRSKNCGPIGEATDGQTEGRYSDLIICFILCHSNWTLMCLHHCLYKFPSRAIGGVNEWGNAIHHCHRTMMTPNIRPNTSAESSASTELRPISNDVHWCLEMGRTWRYDIMIIVTF